MKKLLIAIIVMLAVIVITSSYPIAKDIMAKREANRKLDATLDSIYDAAYSDMYEVPIILQKN